MLVEASPIHCVPSSSLPHLSPSATISYSSAPPLNAPPLFAHTIKRLPRCWVLCSQLPVASSLCALLCVLASYPSPVCWLAACTIKYFCKHFLWLTYLYFLFSSNILPIYLLYPNNSASLPPTLHSVIVVVKHVAFNFPSISYDELERVLVRIYVYIEYSIALWRRDSASSELSRHMFHTLCLLNN